MSDKPKIFRTADGAPIHGGDVVWVLAAGGVCREAVRYMPNGTLMSEHSHSIFAHGVVDPGLCYSHGQAAEDAYRQMQQTGEA